MSSGKEDPGLITGSGKYVGDIKLPGMHHVAFVRSPYAHANILSIDTSAALSREGVLAVVTGEDLRDDYEPVPDGWRKRSARQLQPPGSVDRARAACRRSRCRHRRGFPGGCRRCH